MRAEQAHPYDLLTPRRVLDALDAVGCRGDGRILQLNSYENRVFQLMLEDGGAAVAKFYRPKRWTDAQIMEEHRFALELAAAEVPVIAPHVLQPDARAHELQPELLGQPATLARLRWASIDFRVAVYPRRAGHGPELDDPDVLRWLGRFVGRLHATGSMKTFAVRPTLDGAAFGRRRLQALLASGAITLEQRESYRGRCETALELVDAAFGAAGASDIRLHGDFHPGNILWRDEGPFVVDLDDCCSGPAVQDLWMLLSGPREAMRSQLVWLLEGYTPFARFDERELALIEPLRTLRIVHHSAWLAERWADPAFPAAFPWFGSPNYWMQQIQALGEQIDAMREPPLAL